MARGHEHARVAAEGAARLRLLRVLRVGAVQAARVPRPRPRARAARLQRRGARRARPRRHARPQPTRVVRRRQLLEYCNIRNSLVGTLLKKYVTI